MFDLTRVNWNRLYHFYLVGLHKNITVAARYANIDQSNMSRQILTLEKDLDIELLLRSNNGVTFTEIGEEIFQTVTQMVQLSDEANKKVDSIRNGMKGTLKVLTTQTLMKNCVDYLDDFYQKFPDICVQFDVARKMTDINMLNEYDVAILPKFFEENTIEYIPCRTEKLAIYASKGYLEKYGTPEKPEDLDRHKLIHYSSASSSIGFVDFHLTLGRRGRDVRKSYLHLGTPDSLISACEKGMGIIVYSDEKEIPLPDNFIKILETYYTENIDFYFMLNKKNKHLRKIREFINFFENYLK